MCHVLIIEDEPLIAMDLEGLLEREGATSFSFADTQEGALASAMESKPALITSDVKLIEGTGPAAVAAIQSKLGPIPVIFVTGTPDACKPCEPPGRVFTKPLDRRAFREAFREMAAPEHHA